MKETYVTTQKKMEQPCIERHKQDQQNRAVCHWTHIKNYRKEKGGEGEERGTGGRGEGRRGKYITFDLHHLRIQLPQITQSNL
jgi:hypothetical protein